MVLYLIQDVRIDRQVNSLRKSGELTKEEIENFGADEEEPFRWKDLAKLISNPAFLFITLLCLTFYSAVFPFYILCLL